VKICGISETHINMPKPLKKEHRFILACLRFNKTQADFDEIPALASEWIDVMEKD
jgi:hypothetical protein